MAKFSSGYLLTLLILSCITNGDACDANLNKFSNFHGILYREGFWNWNELESYYGMKQSRQTDCHGHIFVKTL